MNWRPLNAYASTGWLLTNGCGPGRDLLIDMQGAAATLKDSLTAVGSAPARIAHLFLTHHHPDHLAIEEALALAQAGTQVHIGRQTWEDTLESFVRLREPRHTLAAQALDATGRLELLPPQGRIRLDTDAGPPRWLLWRPFPHGDGDRACENLAYAVDDHVFTGDTSIAALFDSAHPCAAHAADLLGLASAAGSAALPPRRVLCLDIAQLTRAAIHDDPELNDRRKRNYLDNHGILEDFLPVLAQPRLQPFFAALTTLVPHHLRRQPLADTAHAIHDQITAAARAQGYTFQVQVPGWQP